MNTSDLRCQDVAVMLANLPDGCASLVHADPPWKYDNGSDTWQSTIPYDGLPMARIAAHLAETWRVAAPNSYLACWCTFPLLFEWCEHNATLYAAGWHYVTGGSWGKTNGLGPGIHFRGDSELLLLYKKDSPRPLATTSNLWLAHRGRHSEKPQTALRALVQMGAPIGGLVVDCYAGESASLALACRALGRNYVGAELSAERHARALTRLSQQEMAWEAVS